MGARRQSKRSGRSVPGVVDRMCVVSEEEFGSMANSSHSRLFPCVYLICTRTQAHKRAFDVQEKFSEFQVRPPLASIRLACTPRRGTSVALPCPPVSITTLCLSCGCAGDADGDVQRFGLVILPE